MTMIYGARCEEALRPYRIALLAHLSTRPFTECFLGMHLDSNTPQFVKVLSSEQPKIKRNFLRELEVLRVLSGQPGFLRLFAACSDPPVYFSACGYISTPSLDSSFGSDESPTMDDVLRKSGRLAQWIRDLHRRGYAHRDLSPDHIFAGDESLPIVIDFGMTKGTAGLSADDARLCEGYDIQAFGMILWELLWGGPLFAYRNERLAFEIPEQVMRIQSAGLPTQIARFIIRSLSVRSEFIPDGLQQHDPFESASELHTNLSSLLQNRNESDHSDRSRIESAQ
jgi:serine/threonine protein kinase